MSRRPAGARRSPWSALGGEAAPPEVDAGAGSEGPTGARQHLLQGTACHRPAATANRERTPQPWVQAAENPRMTTKANPKPRRRQRQPALAQGTTRAYRVGVKPASRQTRAAKVARRGRAKVAKPKTRRRARLRLPPVNFRLPILRGGTGWVGGDLRRSDLYGDDGR
jgi:hypothetical protein